MHVADVIETDLFMGMLDHHVFVHVADVIETDLVMGILDHDRVVHVADVIEMAPFLGMLASRLRARRSRHRDGPVLGHARS